MLPTFMKTRQLFRASLLLAFVFNQYITTKISFEEFQFVYMHQYPLCKICSNVILCGFVVFIVSD